MDNCFKNCNKIEIVKQSKKFFPTHITLLVKSFEDKKNLEFKKLIPRNWEHKEEETNYIDYEEVRTTSRFKGMFSSSIIKPKCKKMFLHFIYKKIEGSNIKDLLVELNKICGYLKNNESIFGCSYGYNYGRTGRLSFRLMFGFDLDINNLEKELTGSININSNIFVRTSELNINPTPEKEIDRSVIKPFQVRVKDYRKYEFYVIHKIGRVYGGSYDNYLKK